MQKAKPGRKSKPEAKLIHINIRAGQEIKILAEKIAKGKRGVKAKLLREWLKNGYENFLKNNNPDEN